MERSNTTKLRIGDWCVDPISGQILRNGDVARVEARTMRLLLYLADRRGEVVSIGELLNEVWSDVYVTQDSVYQAVTSLRRLLGDDPKQPTYIATVPRLGYRMMATVSPWMDSADDSRRIETRTTGASEVRPAAVAFGDAHDSHTAAKGVRGWRLLWIVTAVAILTVAIAIAFQFRRSLASDPKPALSVVASRPQKSIAVLPFLDLTEGMNEEEFADGMTEELIDKLSKIQDLRVPPPTSSFYFKGKKMPLTEIAKQLGVAYVLDGSVRKSGARLRVAARLIRADTGYVIWSETYDRPFDDLLMVQDDIGGEVTKALRASIDATPEPDRAR